MPLTSEQEKELRAVITRTILAVIRTDGGGLHTVIMSRKVEPDEMATMFSSLGEYENWCVTKASEWKDNHVFPDDSDDSNSEAVDAFHSEFYTFTSEMFPMLVSSKDDGGVQSEVSSELMSVMY